MIIEKRPLPDDPTPVEAPPSYDTLVAISHDYKDPKSQPVEGTQVASSSRSGIRPPVSPGIKPPTSPSSPTNNKGKARAGNWFNFSGASTARTTREVRNTILGLVRDLVQENLSTSPAATGVLKSCADACSSHDITLSDILQEKSIENHTPIYWAIVKRPPDEHHDNEPEENLGPDLLTALISYSTPLKPATISEIRLACLATSDQKLFQRLRMSPEFAPMSGVDQMLLGVSIPPDEIEVDRHQVDGGAFAVSFEIPLFHKRMVVSKEISLEFIARSRLWQLAFFVVTEQRMNYPRPGSWCVSLTLLETSPPTFIDSRLIIPEARPLEPLETETIDPSAKPISSPRSNSPSSGFRLPSISNSLKPRPSIELRLKSNDQIEAPRKMYSGRNIIVSLEGHPVGSNLQYGNTSYVGADGKLRGRLEAKLGKPDTDCVIC